jgi:hypothetical protein
VKPPLFIVTGTMGAGKSATAELLPPLLAECVVFDIDWAIASLGMVAGSPIPEHPPAWPGVNDTWLSIAAAIGRAGRPTVLCGPFTPSDLADLPSFAGVGEIHWLLLDCADDVLRARLSARTWELRAIDEALRDAFEMRELGCRTVRTDTDAPEVVASHIVRWVRGHLQ